APGEAGQRLDVLVDGAQRRCGKETVCNPGNVVAVGPGWAVEQSRKITEEAVWRLAVGKKGERVHFEGRASRGVVAGPDQLDPAEHRPVASEIAGDGCDTGWQ